MSNHVTKTVDRVGRDADRPNPSTVDIPQDLDALLTEHQAAAFLSVTVRGLQGWRVRGGGPPIVRLGRLVRYRRRDLVGWIEKQTVANTSAEANDG